MTLGRPLGVRLPDAAQSSFEAGEALADLGCLSLDEFAPVRVEFTDVLKMLPDVVTDGGQTVVMIGMGQQAGAAAAMADLTSPEANNRHEAPRQPLYAEFQKLYEDSGKRGQFSFGAAAIARQPYAALLTLTSAGDAL